jgi:hypothetical protein
MRGAVKILKAEAKAFEYQKMKLLLLPCGEQDWTEFCPILEGAMEILFGEGSRRIIRASFDKVMMGHFFIRNKKSFSTGTFWNKL